MQTFYFIKTQTYLFSNKTSVWKSLVLWIGASTDENISVWHSYCAWKMEKLQYSGVSKNLDILIFRVYLHTNLADIRSEQIHAFLIQIIPTFVGEIRTWKKLAIFILDILKDRKKGRFRLFFGSLLDSNFLKLVP